MSELSDLGSISPQDLDAAADRAARNLKDRQVKTNQIRNLYGSVQRIRAFRDRHGDVDAVREELIRQLIFLKPKLAYASGRTTGLKDLRQMLVEAIDGLVASPRFGQALEHFFLHMESSVAYHRYYSPSDNSR